MSLALFFILVLSTVASTEQHEQYDNYVFEAESNEFFHRKQGFVIKEYKQKRYLLYDANIGEGFNLRRDVYLRLATLVRRLQIHSNERRGRNNVQDDWVLVLPPWGRLYHWRSLPIAEEINIPWSHFFDIDCLKKYVDVIEFEEFLIDGATTSNSIDMKSIDLLYELQYYKDTFSKDGGELVNWTDKVDEGECLGRSPYWRDKDGKFRGPFWGHANVYASNFSCLSMQGPASILIKLLLSKNASSIMLDRSEIMLHDSYGDVEYWKARRSMRFAKRLRDIGDQFRITYLNSSDFTDSTEFPENWQLAKPSRRNALGGPYLAVHLRRQDFLLARPKHVPSLNNAIKQIGGILRRFNLTKVFLSTDAPTEEFNILQEHIEGIVRFVPTPLELEEVKDGGVAIIDQWICAHARYFVGAYESTFSFRIQEEREILGFDPDTTFNRLCGDSERKCVQPTRWLIVYY